MHGQLLFDEPWTQMFSKGRWERMSRDSTSPVTYSSIGMNGQSDMERTLRERTVIIPRGENDIIREEFIQNVIRATERGSKLREDVPSIVIYLSSSRIKDEEGLIMDTLRGFLSAILIIALVGKDSEVSIDLPRSIVKDNLRLFIKNGHILKNDMDNKYMFRRVLFHICELERGWRVFLRKYRKIIIIGVCVRGVCLIVGHFLREHWVEIVIAVSVVCFVSLIVGLAIHFA